MSSEKVNPIKDQPYAISPAMSDAPPPPYSSLYPGYHHAPIQMNPLSTSPFFLQNGVAPPPPPLAPQIPPQMIAPQIMAPTISQMYQSMPQHYIPTAQPYVCQTVVPTAYGPMIAPIQFPANSPMMIPSDCFDPRAAPRFDEMARQTIPIPPFSIVPQSNMALMYGHNGTMLVSKPKKPFY